MLSSRVQPSVGHDVHRRLSHRRAIGHAVDLGRASGGRASKAGAAHAYVCACSRSASSARARARHPSARIPVPRVYHALRQGTPVGFPARTRSRAALHRPVDHASAAASCTRLVTAVGTCHRSLPWRCWCSGCTSCHDVAGRGCSWCSRLSVDTSRSSRSALVALSVCSRSADGWPLIPPTRRGEQPGGAARLPLTRGSLPHPPISMTTRRPVLSPIAPKRRTGAIADVVCYTVARSCRADLVKEGSELQFCCHGCGHRVSRHPFMRLDQYAHAAVSARTKRRRARQDHRTLVRRVRR